MLIFFRISWAQTVLNTISKLLGSKPHIWTWQFYDVDLRANPPPLCSLKSFFLAAKCRDCVSHVPKHCFSRCKHSGFSKEDEEQSSSQTQKDTFDALCLQWLPPLSGKLLSWALQPIMLGTQRSSNMLSRTTLFVNQICLRWSIVFQCAMTFLVGIFTSAAIDEFHAVLCKRTNHRQWLGSDVGLILRPGK